MISLRLARYDCFAVFRYNRFFGYIIRCKGVWICYPDKKMKEFDDDTKKKVYEILRTLNKRISPSFPRCPYCQKDNYMKDILQTEDVCEISYTCLDCGKEF